LFYIIILLNLKGTLLASGSDDKTVRVCKPFDYYYDCYSKLNFNNNANINNSGRQRLFVEDNEDENENEIIIKLIIKILLLLFIHDILPIYLVYDLFLKLIYLCSGKYLYLFYIYFILFIILSF